MVPAGTLKLRSETARCVPNVLVTCASSTAFMVLVFWVPRRLHGYDQYIAGRHRQKMGMKSLPDGAGDESSQGCEPIQRSPVPLPGKISPGGVNDYRKQLVAAFF